MKRFIGLLVFLAAGLAAALALYCVLWQDNANKHFVPVEARLASSSIKTHSGKSTSYSPEATYSYSVDGRLHQSSRVLAFSENGGHAWAQGILSQIARRPPPQPAPQKPKLNQDFDFQDRITAYVNPSDPEESILVRRYSFVPYMFSMGTLLASAIGLGMLLGVVGAGRTTMAAVALDDSGWKLLLPNEQLRTRFWHALWWILGAALALLPAPLHWILVAGQNDPVGWFAGTIALAFLIVLLVIMLRRWSLTHHLSDARLRINPAPMERGQPFALELEADAYAPLHVQKAEGKILCIEHYKERQGTKTVYGTRTMGERTLEFSGPAEIPAGQVISGKAETTFGATELLPTTDPTLKSYPHYTWEIRVLIKLEGMVDYQAVFPLEVD